MRDRKSLRDCSRLKDTKETSRSNASLQVPSLTRNERAIIETDGKIDASRWHHWNGSVNQMMVYQCFIS